jgi:hypothetical protein
MIKRYRFELKDAQGHIWHGVIGDRTYLMGRCEVEIYVDNGGWSGTIDTNGILYVDYTGECFDLTTGEYTFDWHCKEDELLGYPIVF